ncbi:RNA methyltransferase [uncultured Ruminococcus sp.]|uniref:TrmH family RNA methyltransferase n=1 Tax=uncultured Ruminococcus sp. TaxID=165186 RepID=UPI00280543CE|nr:RNA methyltransferase [uncultured Ruminococcus sp.]
MTQMPEKLTARDNSAVKLYRKLARSKKERYREGLFVLEGHRLVTDALRSGASFTHLFWTEEGYTRWNQETIQADLRETRCALLSNELGTDLSQTEHSQGVYAICRMPRQPELSQLIRPGGIYAVLHQLQDPGNAGMILRTADAMGLDGVIYSASCDIYSPKVVRATMGSLFRVPVCCTAAGSLPGSRCGKLCRRGERRGGIGGAVSVCSRNGCRHRKRGERSAGRGNCGL